MRKKLTKEQIKDLNNNFWIYTMLLSTLVILTESLKTYLITIKDTPITLAIFLVPIMYFIANYITKKFGFMRTIFAIGISSISLVGFVALMYFIIGGELNFSLISGQLIGYVISQLVNLFIYCFLLNNTTTPWPLLLINYLFAFIVFYMVYTVIQADMIIKATFWMGYFITLAIQFVEAIILTIIDKQIKRGLI